MAEVTGEVEGEAKVTLKLALPTTPSTHRQNTGDQEVMEHSVVCNTNCQDVVCITICDIMQSCIMLFAIVICRLELHNNVSYHCHAAVML